MTDPQQPRTRREAREASRSGAPQAPGAAEATDERTITLGSLTLRRRSLLVGVAIAVAFLLLCTGAIFTGIAVGHSQRTTAGPATHTGAAPTRVVPGNQLAAQAIPTCSIDPAANATALQKVYGSVVNVSSGKSLYANNDTVGQPPASGIKVLTAAAAISVLGPSFTITTQVQDAPQPGTIVLVGEGDATLSRLPAGQSVYKGAPTLASLASQTLTAYNNLHPGIPITQVILDSTYWDPTDNWDPTWPRTEQTGGFQSEVTALQVDGDRADPTQQISPRSTNPIMAAGQAFVTALGLDPSAVQLTMGAAENGAPVLASVQSQPVSALVSQMLLTSDNTLGEMLARIVSVKESLGGSSSSLQTAIPMALGKFGVDTSHLIIKDGSGESDEDAVPAQVMAQFMAAVSQKQNGLQYVAAGMPLAGKTGSLASRFQGANAVAIGKIYAKPGFIATAYSLSGYMTAKDGTALAFAFYGVGQGITSSANGALDTLATAVYNCGKNLSNN